MRVTVGEQTFDVQVSGDPGAPTVLLLHGFPQSAHCWRGVIPHLADYHVLAPDQRGYSPGARPAEVESYRVPRLVEDALALLDAFEVETAHVVGHDWGASVAWQLGARHAGRVRTLTALSVPHPRAFMAALAADPEQRAKSLYMRDFAQPGYDQVLLADDAARLREIFGGLPSVDVEHVVDRAREPGALAAWLRWYAAQRREDLADTPAVTVPTLHVWSDHDVALGRAGTVGTAEWVTGPYRLEVLEGVSHWIPEEAASQLGALLVSTVRELVEAVRPGVVLREVEGVDEVVFHGGDEVFRLPLTDVAIGRQRVLVTSLPSLFALLPVAVPRPRFVGVLTDGATPFTAEKRLPGVPVEELRGIAAGQWEGVQAGLESVSPGQVREWGGLFRPTLLLADPRRGVLTGLVEWR